MTNNKEEKNKLNNIYVGNKIAHNCSLVLPFFFSSVNENDSFYQFLYQRSHRSVCNFGIVQHLHFGFYINVLWALHINDHALTTIGFRTNRIYILFRTIFILFFLIISDLCDKTNIIHWVCAVCISYKKRKKRRRRKKV